ncbi:MAG: NAD(P)(+) transhydrogenase (Re/Si-specific) subunit beta, partial [Actinomycetota bacterium]|nr:NAD(P)(+) transhydrogenase (Re/Si-specific) subunit beta [Actinomycetota bacterium]
MQVATFLAYIAAAALFIVGIRRLRKPETARSGNTIAAVGMTVALVATLFVIRFEALLLIGVAAILGSLVGALTAQRVQMTAMPQMVAAYNGVGGGAAALIALSEFYHLQT